jgi:cytochrome c peroxidase
MLLTNSATATLLGDEPALGAPESRITQLQIESGALSFKKLRQSGLKVFSTRYNKADGYGDGELGPVENISPGGRPTLQNNGTFLRINGLDAQTCMECHTIVSADTVPFTLGVGGAGGLNNSASFQPRFVDVEDAEGNLFAKFDGRLINPLSLFGSGGVQMLAKEMTAELQALKAKAIATPGTPVQLATKGVEFGTIIADEQGNLDTSNLEGVDDDLVIRPFGRKGEFSSVRQFDLGAMQFHFGMEPIEVVGEGIDKDNDGVADEIRIGEISALEIFLTTMETPQRDAGGATETKGFQRFQEVGCADCHRPFLNTDSFNLNYSYPEVEDDPSANVFYSFDLRKAPTKFTSTPQKGLQIELFSDLKRHDMGPGLAESFHLASEKQNREFITAKLWGVADTSPYLHDGRALTLNEAILSHGGEAQVARDTYASLSDRQKNHIIRFLNTLRNPTAPNSDVAP